MISLHASPLGDLGRGENGGMNLAIRRLCEGLWERGIPSDVFVRRDDSDGPDEQLIAPGSRLVRLPVGPRRRVSKHSSRFLTGAFAEAIIAHAQSERRVYRVVHAHYWLGGLVARELRKQWPSPWVQSFHTLARAKSEAGLPAEPDRAAAEAELVRAADRLVAISKSEGHDLVRLYGAAASRIRVAHPGVDISRPSREEIAGLRRGLGVTGRRVILYAGRLEPLKGADVLLRALAQLHEAGSFDDVTALLIGDNSGDGAASGQPGGERGRLEKLVSELRLGGNVRFLGAVAHDDLPAHYALADVCVVPSRTETFGFVALEAQAAGTPVVAANVGGLREAVEDAVTGYLVASESPEQFARRIATLLEDEELRWRMGENARKRAESFTWQRAVERLSGIYEQLAAEPRGVAGLRSLTL
jgi:D-inositol-3-phosphate glycosyltransferase